MSRATIRRRGPACAGLAAVTMAAVTLSLRLAAAGQDPPAATPRSAWDGVFTSAQVERGRTAYNAQCARCHGEALGGGENSPPLVDDRFFATWAGRSVGQLVEYTRTTMPSDGPGRIPRRRCIDIAAFLLRANGFPPGDAEFPTDLDALDRITITRTR
jgi:cytochrome c